MAASVKGEPGVVVHEDRRDGAVAWMLWISLFAVSFSALSFWSLAQTRTPPREGWALLPGWVLIVCALLAPRRWRPVGMFAGMLVAAFGVASSSGFGLPNPVVATFALTALAALMLPAVLVWRLWAGTLLLWGACGVWFMTVAPLPSGPAFDPVRPENWLRITAVYGGLSVGLMAVVSLLVSRMERAIVDNDHLLETLARETDRRALVLQQERLLDAQLQQSQKLGTLSALAGGVAHDFSNLLMVMLNRAEQIAQQARLPEHRRAAENIAAAAERGSALSRQLSSFNARQGQVCVRLDVADSVGVMVPLVQRLLPDNISLETDVAPSLPAVSGPVVAIEQIVLNLCVNARDAMPDGGRIRIEAAQRDGQVCLRVVDEGVGMDAATVARVFEPFFTTKPAGQGTGLGLATVRALVQQCGGRIAVESAPGRGTTFELLLPGQASGPSEQAALSSAAAPIGLAGAGTILVVEDDAEVREVILSALEQAGYTVVRAIDGSDALRVFAGRRDEIGLIVSDAVMPGLSLAKFHAAVRAERPGLPFLVCSGYGGSAAPAETLTGPFSAFLAKPFHRRELLAAVRALLERRQGSGAAAVLGAPARSGESCS